MKFPPTVQIDELAELCTLARFACNQIERYAAALVLVGVPGGQGTLLATQALWAATRAAPFPPVAAIHLSEQHVTLYEQLPHRATGHRSVGFALGILEAGPYLAWVHRKAAWQAELRAAVEAALGPGGAPTSVVVLGGTRSRRGDGSPGAGSTGLSLPRGAHTLRVRPGRLLRFGHCAGRGVDAGPGG